MKEWKIEYEKNGYLWVMKKSRKTKFIEEWERGKRMIMSNEGYAKNEQKYKKERNAEGYKK